MAGSIGLNDVAAMLSTRSGDISTIGGAIGCMTAMISADAREKESTTANDVKQIKEFVCGDGGTLAELFGYIHDAIVENGAATQKLVEGQRMGSMVKKDITTTITSSTGMLGGKLDSIEKAISRLTKIMSSKEGKVDFGDKRKAKDDIDKFKDAMGSVKKMENSKIGQFLSVITQLNGVKLRDLLFSKTKIGMIQKLVPQLKELAGSFKKNELENVKTFFDNAPDMFKNLLKASLLSKLIGQKGLQKFSDFLGVGKKNEEEQKGLLGIIRGFEKLDKKKLDKAKRNINSVFRMIASICFGVSMLVLFSPIIIVGALIVKPLQWALFGFKGDGGIMGLFKKISEHSDDIKEANKAILWMGLGLAGLGAGLGLLFLLTKNIEWEQLLIVAVTTVVFGGIIGILGQFKDDIKEGSEAMLWMALGIAGLGLGLGILFGLTSGITLEQVLLVGLSTVLLGGAVYALGLLNKDGMVYEGSLAMLVMGACLIPFGISMKLLMGSVRGMKWGEFGMLAASIGLLGGAVIGLGALMMTGFGAIAWVAGIAAIGAMGIALIPFGIGMSITMKVAKKIDLKDIERLVEGTKKLFEGLGESADKKKRKNAEKNAKTLGRIGWTLVILGKGLKRFNDVASDSIDKAINAISKIAEFFFGEEGMSKYSTTWASRRKARKEADTIGTISEIMYKLSYGLRTFNDVAPDSIDKAMAAIERIAFYFFSPDSALNGMNTKWRDRRKAEKTADAIGNISDCVWKLATGLKDFNDVADTSIDKAMDAINKISFYFFSPSSELNSMNLKWQQRRQAKKNADAIGVIADSIYKVSQSLKDFNQIGDNAVTKATESVNSLVQCFLADKFKIDDDMGDDIGDNLKDIGKGLAKFQDKTKDVDIKRVESLVNTTSSIVTNIFSKWNPKYEGYGKSFGNSIESISDSLNGLGKNSDTMAGADKLEDLFTKMSKPGFTKANRTIKSATKLIKNVNTIDLSRAKALTDLFKSFASIGKGGGIFNRFDKRVRQFTDACLELVNAINGNTEAINNSEEEVVVKDASGTETTMKRKDAEFLPKQMTITNVDDLAMAIAEQLNSLNVDCDANVNLQINNESGSEWRIVRM